jgi:hypothetical protein
MVSRTQNRVRQAAPLSQSEGEPDLPHDQPLSALQQLSIRLDRLPATDEISAGRGCELVERIAKLGRPTVAKLLGEYLSSAERLNDLHGRQMWSTVTCYLDRLVCAYRWCLERYEASAGMGKSTAAVLAPVAIHAIQACAARQKWAYLRYRRVAAEQWAALVWSYLLAERARLALEEPPRPGLAVLRSGAEHAFLKALALAAASPGGLAPLQIEIAERLIERCGPQLALAQGAAEPATYFIDLSATGGLQRLLPPKELPSSARIVVLSRAMFTLRQFAEDLDSGLLSPADLGLELDWRCAPELVAATIRHLLRHWSRTERRHPRHREVLRMAVVHGFDEVASKVPGPVTHDPSASDQEHWIVENRSESGVFAILSHGQGRALGPGSLIAFQYSRHRAWHAGIIRRVECEDEETRHFAIEALTTGTSAVNIQPRFRRSAAERDKGVVGVHLIESPASVDQISLLLPTDTFSLSTPLQMRVDGREYLLIPQQLVESGNDYQIARFKLLKSVQ